MNRTSSPRAGNGFWRIFGVPTLLGVMSAVGLISALLGDDVWDALSWLTLGIPLLVIGWYVARPVRG